MTIQERIFSGLAKQMAKRGYSLEDPNTPLGEALRGMLGGPTTSGVVVNETTAMKVAAVLACVRILSESIASLPIMVYRRLPGGGSEEATDHYAYKLLHDAPNEYMSAYTWKQVEMMKLLLGTGTRSVLDVSPNGTVRSIIPLPRDTRPRLDKDGRLWFDAIINGKGFTFPDGNVISIPGLGFDGIDGKSVISYAAEAVGLSLAIEDYGASFYGRGANPSGVIESEKQASKEVKERLTDTFEVMYGGLSKAHRTMILSDGLKWKPMSISPMDAQALEAKRFQVSEIARMFRVPLMLLQFDQSTTTYASAEQFNRTFVQYTLAPYCVAFEQAINRRLFSSTEQKTYYVKFNLDAFLRGDFTTRQQGLKIQRDAGVISKNDWRKLEDMNPIADGDDYKSLAEIQNVKGLAAEPDPAA